MIGERTHPHRSLRWAAWIVLAAHCIGASAYAASTTVFATVDNKVVISSANAAWQDTVYGNTDLGIGCNWELYYYDGVPYQSFLCARTLVWFDLGALIAGKTIQSATLRVYPYLLPSDLGTSYSVAPILANWGPSTVTWDNQPAAGAAVDTLSPPVTTVLPMEFDVTHTVQEWADGTRSNYGFRIRDVADTVFPYATLYRVVGLESLEYWFGSSRRPQLHLEIADAAAPTLTFWADPARIATGESSTLRWQSTNTTSCYSTQGSWGSPSMPTSGSVEVTLRVSQTYGLGCTGPGGSIEKTVTVTVPEPASAAGAALALFALGGLALRRSESPRFNASAARCARRARAAP